ncbi:MAG: hypothetical protein RSG96_10280, partial [Clostridia bacterium]
YPNGLEQLDQAGMLLDLSQSDYLASRKSVEKGVEGWDGLPNGIFSLDNRLIGVPCYPFVVYESHDQVQVLIINAKGSHIEDAIRYVEYHIKGMEDVALTPDDEAFERNCLEYSTALWEPQQ